MNATSHANSASVHGDSTAQVSSAVLGQFAAMIAAAARLPLLAVSNWTTRAAQAINAGSAGSASLVILFDPTTGELLHAGAASATMPPAASFILLSHSEDLARTAPSPLNVAAKPIAWESARLHPFFDAGFPAGEVIGTHASVTDKIGIAIYVYRSRERLGQVGCTIVDGVRDFLVQNLRTFVEQSIHWLSVRESDVLDLVSVGYSVNEIAAKLGRSPHTVHDHLKSIHRKTGASTRGQLIAAATGHQSINNQDNEEAKRSMRFAEQPAVSAEVSGGGLGQSDTFAIQPALARTL